MIKRPKRFQQILEHGKRNPYAKIMHNPNLNEEG